MDITTVRGVRRASDRIADRALALTVAYHPDPTRIGDRVALVAGTNEVSRGAPLFGGAAPRPLATPFISRQPFLVALGEEVTLSPGDAGPLRLEGRIVTETARVDAERLAAGVVVEVGELAFVLHETVSGAAPAMGFVGGSAALERVRRQIERVASYDVPVLVRGESGVGKELVARALHDRSGRAAGPFVSVNMAAIPAATGASALFGHKRGAFTGAERDHGGFFGEAAGGTLFLDEIGETPDDLQPALLRALESGEIQPVGAGRPRQSDCRLVAATDLALEEAVDEGRFRLPLLMRLAGYEIVLPPLRERRADIPVLLVHFLHEELQLVGRPELLAPPPPGAEGWLPRSVVVEALAAPWNGNVRELRNAARKLVVDNADERQILHRTFSMGRGAPWPREASPENESQVGVPSSSRSLEDIDEAEVLRALERHDFRPQDAARLLGISKTSIYALMRRLAIPTSSDLDGDAIREAIRASGGDIVEAARALKVSSRALKLRMRSLGLR